VPIQQNFQVKGLHPRKDNVVFLDSFKKTSSKPVKSIEDVHQNIETWKLSAEFYQKHYASGQWALTAGAKHAITTLRSALPILCEEAQKAGYTIKQRMELYAELVRMLPR
jgi:hypothetical protein